MCIRDSGRVVGRWYQLRMTRSGERDPPFGLSCRAKEPATSRPEESARRVGRQAMPMKSLRSEVVGTDRLRRNCWMAGPEDGTPVLLVHGNLVSGDDVAKRLPDDVRI